MGMIEGEYDGKRGPHIMMASRKMFFPFDPRPDEFEWTDVGAGLSRVCRFNGQLPTDEHTTVGPNDIYSVAQHSCMAGALLDKEHPDAPEWLRLALHLHDGDEALCGIGDPCGPVKRSPLLEPVLRPYLDKIADAVAAKAGLDGKHLRCAEVKVYDKLVYAWEDRDIRGHEQKKESHKRLPSDCLVPWTPAKAFMVWMSRLNLLLDEYQRVATL
jgi:hypothetical protein